MRSTSHKFFTVSFLIFSFATANAEETFRECYTKLNNIRLTTGNVLFVGDESRETLDKAIYSQTFAALNGKTQSEILYFLHTNTEYRILDAEEVIAALDVLVPTGNSMFGI